ARSAAGKTRPGSGRSYSNCTGAAASAGGASASDSGSIVSPLLRDRLGHPRQLLRHAPHAVLVAVPLEAEQAVEAHGAVVRRGDVQLDALGFPASKISLDVLLV